VGVGQHLLGTAAGLGDDALGLVRGIGDRALGFPVRPRDGLPRLLAGSVDQVVALVEHVLRVVHLAGQRVADVVEQFEDVTAGHDATGRHGQPTRLFDDRDELVERLENPVHGNSNPLS